ncbi:MAG: hypothetical protein RIS36_1679 [Pseudomonadota bacterium]
MSEKPRCIRSLSQVCDESCLAWLGVVRGSHSCSPGPCHLLDLHCVYRLVARAHADKECPLADLTDRLFGESQDVPKTFTQIHLNPVDYTVAANEIVDHLRDSALGRYVE